MMTLMNHWKRKWEKTFDIVEKEDTVTRVRHLQIIMENCSCTTATVVHLYKTAEQAKATNARVDRQEWETTNPNGQDLAMMTMTHHDSR